MKVENLKRARELKGLNQTEVALHLGISQQRYNYYETGKREPDNEMLKRIAGLLNVTTDYLLGYSSKPNLSELIIPDILKGAKVAAHDGEDDWTQEEIDKLAEFAAFIKSQRKGE